MEIERPAYDEKAERKASRKAFFNLSEDIQTTLRTGFAHFLEIALDDTLPDTSDEIVRTLEKLAPGFTEALLELDRRTDEILS